MHAEIFILMSMVGAVTFILYLLISSRHKERLALLEFDRDATVFHPERRLRTSWALRFGLLLLFGGVGLLFGYLVHWILGIPEKLATFAFLLIAAGGGLLTYFFIGSRLERHD